MIIDAHAHGLTEGYLETLRSLGGEQVRKRAEGQLRNKKSVPAMLDLTARLEQLERHGIDLQVVTPSVAVDVNVLPGDASTQLAIARALNDSMASMMEESKGRVVSAGTTTLTFFEQGGRQEMDRAIKSLGLKAIALPSNLSGKPLDSPEFEPFWAHAQEMNVTVYIHPSAQPGRTYEQVYDLPHIFGWPYETTITLSRLVFSGVMERYPNLKIVSHHLGGGMIPFFMGRIVESTDPTSQSGDRSPKLPKPLFDYFSRFYYDSAVGGCLSALRCACEVLGAGQIVFATDYPWGPRGGESRLETYPEMIPSMGLSPEETEMILSGNARRILNLD